ncbi:MAG: ribonuclease III [Oscillospiraceae bacterium]|nr:ribonuclease III [Oscillospiraceae bacterium]
MLTEKEAAGYSPNVLAFYGDSVYEVMVRRRVVIHGNTNAGRLHDLAVEQVRARYQADAVSVIEPMLTEREADILRRGRNAGGISVPKSSRPSEYRRATALEALFGYLSLIGREDRLEELFGAICEALPTELPGGAVKEEAGNL